MLQLLVFFVEASLQRALLQETDGSQVSRQSLPERTLERLSRKLASLGAPWGEALAGVVVYANEVSGGVPGKLSYFWRRSMGIRGGKLDPFRSFLEDTKRVLDWPT